MSIITRMNPKGIRTINGRPVLLVNMTLNSVRGGGTAERTRQLARYILKSGHDCRLVTISDIECKDNAPTIEGFGGKVLSFRSLSQRFHIPLVQPKILWKEIGKAGIIHLMNHWTLINALVYLFAKIRKIPVVICPAGSLRIVGRSRWLKKIYAFLIGNWMIRGADGVIIIAENERDHFSSNAMPSSVRLIPNGIDPNEFSNSDPHVFRRQFGLPEKSPLILFMGRLNHIKGPDILLKAFLSDATLYKDYHLVFAGPDDGMGTSLQEMCRRSGKGDHVHFIGYVGGALKPQAYHAASFLVIPSRQEAMSIVALESGAASTPVLLTDACGFDEIEIIGGGRVVKPTATELAWGMRRMVDSSEELPAMGKILKSYVLSKFSWPEIVDQHLSYFNQLISR